MPPYVPRKRPSASPAADAHPTKRPAASNKSAKAGKATPARTKSKNVHSVSEAKAFLKKAQENDPDSDSESDLSDAPAPSSVPNSIRNTDNAIRNSESEVATDSDSDASSDAGIDWAAELEKDVSDLPSNANDASGDVRVTLDEIKEVDTTFTKRKDGKKYAPSKREKAARIAAHCMHVQCLMVHNHMRNYWCDDKEIQQILVDAMSEGCRKEVKRWVKACGNTLTPSAGVQGNAVDGAEQNRPDPSGKGKANDKTPNGKRKQRDWGADAGELELGVPIMTHGDPSLRLLKFLSAYWKKRFRINAPGLRKLGYKDNRRIARERAALQAGQYDPDVHGERVSSKAQFMEAARKCQGSRDVGSQLFTALLRGIGMEARFVASLQPLGFGWTKNEEADPPKRKAADDDTLGGASLNALSPIKTKEPKSLNSNGPSKGVPRPMSPVRLPRTPNRKQTPKGNTKADAIKLETSDSDLSSPPVSDAEMNNNSSTVTPSKPLKKYDRDLAWPVYWTEVISPVTRQCIAVDPMVLNVIASNEDSFVIFEPRGAKADKARQVMAYVVAFSSDRSAKDVTTRYLKKHVWPGKTKGTRYPAEKLALRNRKGKVIRYVDQDFFGDLISLYNRPKSKRTTADDLEDQRDLKPVMPDKDSGKGPENETLQWYKSSAEFVLERHLRREEALVPSAIPVKQFTTGKGDNTKSEPVFLRADVLPCRTVESWHKEGREVKENEQPLKRVPMRAVTTIRKRQIELAESQMGGEKMMQGLYAKYQTDWIIPPPIENGAIPKNAYGNMDVYVPTMVPDGAVHLPLKGTAKVCRKLGIDYAEAVTGFEFGNRMAVPILTGVVVARENEHAVIDAWQADQAIQRQREAVKREKANLGMWKRFMTGLRVIERMRQEYGDDEKLGDAQVQEAVNQATAKRSKGSSTIASQKSKSKSAHELINLDSDAEEHTTGKRTKEDPLPGGFLQEDEDVSDVSEAEAVIIEGDDINMATAAHGSKNSHRVPISLAQMAADEDSQDTVESDPDDSTVTAHVNGSGVDRGKNKGIQKQILARATGAQDGARGGRAASSSGKPSTKSKADTLRTEDEQGADVKRRQPSDRKAARKSKDAVRSHYFAHSEDGEQSIDGLSEGASDDGKPPLKKARGSGGHGQGREASRQRGK